MTPSPIVRPLSLALFMSTPAFGQIIDVSAGASTLYGSEGASVAIHSGTSETLFGAGVINGHFGYGASSTKQLRGGYLTSGEQQLSMDLPTDIFGGGPVFLGMGIGYRTIPADGQQIRGFVGVSSKQGGTPLFQSSRLESLAVYSQWKRPITGTLTSLSTALFSARTGISLLESLSWKASRSVSYAVTAGVGSGSPYAAASAAVKKRKLALNASYVLASERFQRAADPNLSISEPVRENAAVEYQLTRAVSVSGLHRNYLTSTSLASDSNGVHSGGSVSSAVDEAAIQYHRRSTVLSVTVLSSRARQQNADGFAGQRSSNTGLAMMFNRRMKRLEWSESLYETRNAGGTRDAFIVSGVTANINPHLRLTEAITNSGNGTTFAHGGGFITQFSSFEVDYQMLYLAARPDHPFQQAMVFDSRLRLFRDVWLQATSSIGPTGATLYTLRIGKQFARASVDSSPMAPAAVGDNLVQGQVVDQNGLPVEGAALKIDTTEIYTDSRGSFSFREKTVRSHALSVALDDFLDLDSFAVVRAPASVRSAHASEALPVIIVVKRVTNANGRQDGDTGATTGTRRPLTVPRAEP